MAFWQKAVTNEERELTDGQMLRMEEAARIERQQRQSYERERAEQAAAKAELDAWLAEIEERAEAVDPAALSAAEAALDQAVDELDRLSAAVGQARDSVARLEAKSAAALELATLDELQRIATGKQAANTELTAARAVLAELERRQRAARDAVDAVRSRVGQVKTAGLAALADIIAGHIAQDADDLAQNLEGLTRLQRLIQARGGSGAGRLVAAEANARRLAAMVDAYRKG